jgi:hypothetical protein
MDTTERQALRCSEPLQNVNAQYRQLCVKLKAFCFGRLAILQILALTLNGSFADAAIYHDARAGDIGPRGVARKHQQGDI